jgi:hypothetical protein
MAGSASEVAGVKLDQRYFDSWLSYGSVCLTHIVSNPLGTHGSDITINTFCFHSKDHPLPAVYCKQLTKYLNKLCEKMSTLLRMLILVVQKLTTVHSKVTARCEILFKFLCILS